MKGTSKQLTFYCGLGFQITHKSGSKLEHQSVCGLVLHRCSIISVVGIHLVPLSLQIYRLILNLSRAQTNYIYSLVLKLLLQQ